MKRGNLYRVYKGNKLDPKDYRVFVVVSRQELVDSSAKMESVNTTLCIALATG
jgi:hypothetical protein